MAIVGLTPLTTFAVRELLLQASDKFIIETSVSPDSLFPSADFHIITFDVFVKHLQFFMPRKHRIALVCNDSSVRRQDHRDEEILTIYLTDPIETITSRLCRAIPQKKAEPISVELTVREKEVLSLLAQGQTIKEIAAGLGISVNTTLTHRKNISAKLDIRSVSGLSLYAMINGLI